MAYTDDSRQGDAQAIIEEVHRHAEPDTLKRGDLVAISPGKAIVDLRQYERRVKAAVQLGDVESFLAYVAQFYDAEAATAWVDPDRYTVVAVLNDHAASLPDERDHRATLALKQTAEWKRWANVDRQWLDQESFADHIADCVEDIAEPTAAELLELAQHFEATTSAEFKGGTRLDSGAVTVQYVETVDARAGQSGQLTIPKEIILALAPFYGEQRIAVTARFRYRLRNGDLQLSVVLADPDKVVRESVMAVKDRVAEQISRTYLGTP